MKCLIKEKLSAHKYKDNNGYLICVDSVLARTGKQTYLRSEIFADAADDNTEIEVDRKPEEVFDSKTLASFENCPLCIEHPDEDVNPENHRDLSVGFVRDVHKGNIDGQDVILGTLVVQDQEAIDLIENDKMTDLSCGYDCDIEDSVNPQQRNIRGNHVALCECGRAGNARIVDSINVKDDIVFDYTEEDLKKAEEMMEKTIDTNEAKLLSTLIEKIKFELQNKKFEDAIKDERIIANIYNKNGKFIESKSFSSRVQLDNFANSLENLYDMTEEKDLYKTNRGNLGVEKVWNIVVNDKLIESSSEEAFKKNIATEIRAGKDPKQAAAIAYSIQRENDSACKDYQNREISNKRIEEVPFDARNYLREAKDKKAALLAITSQLEDIINAAEPEFRNDLVMKKNKILNDLKTQFNIQDEIKDTTYTIQQHNGKWYYEIKEDDGFTHLVGPYTSMEEAIIYFKKHRPNETLTDEESTAEKVTKNLEKNFENFKETRMKDDSDLSLLREYFKEKQPSRKMELHNKLRSMGYKQGVDGVNSSSRLWVELNGKKYEVKNLSSVTPLDSIKDSTFVIRYKDLYNDIKHEEEIDANSINEAVELLKRNVAIRGIGTANVYVERIENKSSREYYPRAYGKLNSLTVDSNKLKDDMKVVSKWFKTSGNTPVSSAILQNKEGYTFYSGIIREDKDFQTLQQAEEYAKILGYTKDSIKDSLIKVMKVVKVLKKNGNK